MNEETKDKIREILAESGITMRQEIMIDFFLENIDSLTLEKLEKAINL